VKTVPTLRVVSKTEAPAELDQLGVADLPAEVRLALADIAGAARDGLLAMSVAAGLAVMQAMFDAEITAACGPKGRHDPDRAATRHGAGEGSVVLGGRRVPVRRPRARTVDGHEVPLAAYRLFTADDLLSRVVLERMLAGVATRRHARTAGPISEQATGGGQKSTSRSAVSRRFVKQTENGKLRHIAHRTVRGPISRRNDHGCNDD
jgi:putative transposase